MKKATRKRATALDLSNPFALATIGTSFSPAAYCDRETGRPVTTLPQPELATHVFEPTGDGCLRHSVNGRERAIVPPEGLDDYALTWPACADLARTLKRADR